MTKVLNAIDRLSDYCGYLSGILFFAIGGMISYEVVARYVFISPTIWSEQFSRFFQIWAVYLAAAYVLRHGKLIRITLLLDILSPRIRHVMEALSLVFIAVFAGVAIYEGTLITFESIEMSRTSTSVLAVPMWMVESAIPLGGSLLLVQCLAQLARMLRGEAVDFGKIEEQI